MLARFKEKRYLCIVKIKKQRIMNTINFTTSLGHQMTIENNTVTVVNKFGDRYRCEINENGKLVAKGSLSLAVCMRAMNEYRSTL